MCCYGNMFDDGCASLVFLRSAMVVYPCDINKNSRLLTGKKGQLKKEVPSIAMMTNFGFGPPWQIRSKSKYGETNGISKLMAWTSKLLLIRNRSTSLKFLPHYRRDDMCMCKCFPGGGYSSMIWVGTCRWDLKSRPIFIPNFAKNWDPFLYQSHKF